MLRKTLLAWCLISSAVLANSSAGPSAAAADTRCAPTSSYRGWVQKLRATEAFTAPAGSRAAVIDRAGTTVLPSGRLLTPAGTTTTVGPHPYGLAVSPDGLTAVTSNSGSAPFSLSLLTLPGSGSPVVRTVVPRATGGEVPTVFMGLAFSPDGRTLYASGGASGAIQVVDVATASVTETVDLDGSYGGRTWQGSFLGDLALSHDGSKLYVVDQANFRLVEVGVGLAGLTPVRSLATGRYPFSVALSPDDRHAYVAAYGTYEYRPVVGYDGSTGSTALTFPPYGAPTTASLRGTTYQHKKVPPLGSPNDPASAAVWDLDLVAGRAVAKTKTGPLVGQVVDGLPATGTSAPAAVLADGGHVWVSNNHSDTVALLDRATDRVLASIRLQPSAAARDLRGVQPFGLARSPDRTRLFVAESGLNAVAVIDTASRKVLGHIPTGWLPSKVQVSPDGTTLYVANARGFGNGPNASVGAGAGRPGGTITNGTFEAIPLVGLETALPRWTRQVLTDAGLVPRHGGPVVRGLTGTRPDVPVKHVVVVVKENRTYDQVLGDVGAVSNRVAVGSSPLANAPVIGYGEHATVAGSVDPAKPQVLDDVDVTPNHHALARRYAFSDNFYSDADVSADGHRWLVGVQPDAFVETSFPQSYGGGLSYSPETGPNPAPGRRAVTAAQAALSPEEYAEAGSIWENAQRSGLSYYDFGEGLELADSDEQAEVYPTGAYYGLNTPLPAALYDHTAKDFPEFNTTISDQYRVDVFLDHLRRRRAGSPTGLPALTYLILPQDHGGTPSAALGYPYLQSFPADNDLALGRLVHGLSTTRDWSSTAVLVLEDDPQGGFDTVDAHRTIGMVISPWAKRGYVSGAHSSTAGLVKTVELLLGLPMLNQADATAGDLLDQFTDTPDVSPYPTQASDLRVFDPTKVRRLGTTTTRVAGVGSQPIDDPDDRPAGQPGGPAVRVGGKVVDERPRPVAAGPRAPVQVTAQAVSRICATADPRPLPGRGLAATGLAEELPALAVLLLTGFALVRRRARPEP